MRVQFTANNYLSSCPVNKKILASVFYRQESNILLFSVGLWYAGAAMETVKAALYHSAPGQVSSRNQWHQTLLCLSKGEKTSHGATRIVFQHSFCLDSVICLLSGFILGTLSKTSFLVSYFQEHIVFNSGDRSNAGYWSEIQRTQFVNNQSLNNNERKPLFLILSPFCVDQCWRKGTWPLGGVLFCQEASLGSEVHLSNVSLIPHHLTRSWWGLVWQMNLKYFTTLISFSALFQPHCK